MRALLLPALACLFLVGCEVAALGARCDNDTDCDKNTTAPTAQCRSFSNPGTTCSGGDCLCCPTDTSTLANLINQGYPLVNCMRTTLVLEAGTDSASDASDAAPDTGVLACAVTCTLDQFCDTTTGRCRSQRASGLDCTAGNQCQTSFCVGASGGAAGVCCNSACTTAGSSCNSSPDQRGFCVANAVPFDATVTDAVVPDSAPADSATVPDAATPDAAVADSAPDASAG